MDPTLRYHYFKLLMHVVEADKENIVRLEFLLRGCFSSSQPIPLDVDFSMARSGFYPYSFNPLGSTSVDVQPDMSKSIRQTSRASPRETARSTSITPPEHDLVEHVYESDHDSPSAPADPTMLRPLMQLYPCPTLRFLKFNLIVLQRGIPKHRPEKPPMEFSIMHQIVFTDSDSNEGKRGSEELSFGDNVLDTTEEQTFCLVSKSKADVVDTLVEGVPTA
ncbi:hypothetical protein Ddye_004936 [Dipteronia dyeriana]|uniref:Uncharacterized protein n=1 Tax=Dipteronia dyeriana TaxID=168575 RepID=A0AAD9XG47_9ROSI|nr:hypothetical protein Ddye_004936 [Dipteronia dyeriana]